MAGTNCCEIPSIGEKRSYTTSISYVVVEFGFPTDVKAWQQSESMYSASMNLRKYVMSVLVSLI